MMWRFFIVSFLSFYTCLQATSQILNIKKYGIEDGLPSNRVGMIVQTDDGTMWFATKKGLCWYDSYKFRSIPFSEENKRITNLYKGKDSIIWVGTFNGLFYYDKYNGSEELTSVNINSKYFIGTYLIVFDQDEVGRIWTGNQYGFFYYNHEDHSYKHFWVDNKDTLACECNKIEALKVDPTGKDIWLVNALGDVYLFNIETEKLRIHPDLNGIGATRSIIFEGDSALWFGTVNNGLYRYSLQSRDLTQYTSENSLLSSNSIRSMTDIRNNEFMIGTDGGGLDIFNIRSGCWKNLTEENFQLSNNKIHGICLDRDGNLWLGHYMGGVTFIESSDFKFQSVYYSDTTSVLKYPFVTAFLEDSKGNLWIGNDEGGALKIQGNSRNVEVFRDKLKSNYSQGFDAVVSLFEDADNNIWIGTYKGGVSRIDAKTREIRNFRNMLNDSSTLPKNDVRAIVQDNSKNMWFSMHGGGVCCMNPITFEIINYINIGQDSLKRVKSNWCRNMKIDSHNRLWICTSVGLEIFDVARDRIVTSEIFANIPYSDIDYPYDVCFIENGGVAIAANNGAYIINNDYTHMQKIEVKYNDFEPASVLFSNDELWFSTFNGLLRYNTITQESFMFEKSDGLPDNVFLRNATYKTDDGKLFFGTINGYVSFYPNDIIIDTSQSNIVLTEFRLFNKEIYPSSDQSPLERHINFIDKITLKHDQNIFSVVFANTAYSILKENKYKYFLKGIDKYWVEVENEPVATYMNLPPGEYTLQINATNRDGVWNATNRELIIEVLPPWWATVYFRLVLLVFTVSILVLIVMLRERTIKSRNKILKKAVEKRTEQLTEQQEQMFVQNIMLNEKKEEMEQIAGDLKDKTLILEQINHDLEVANNTKNKLLSVLAHDIKNPFGVLLNFADLLNKRYEQYDEEKRKLFVSKINDASKSIYAMFDNLLNWTRTQSSRLNHAPEQFSLSEIVLLVLDQYKIAIEEKNIKVDTNIIDSIDVFADLNMTKVIVRNVLGNAVKFSKKNGSLRLLLNQTIDSVEFSVIDSGIGMSTDMLDNLFSLEKTKMQEGTNQESGTGLGLIVSKEFAELNGGSISVQSKEGEGTAVKVSLLAVTEKVEN